MNNITLDYRLSDINLNCDYRDFCRKGEEFLFSQIKNLYKI